MRLGQHLLQPVDNSSLVLFRIGFGFCLILHILPHASGDSYYLTSAAPALQLPYPGLEWLKPPPEDILNLMFIGLVVAACGIMLGLAYRLSCLVYTLGAAYIHFMDAARFYNHYYLVWLITLLLTFMPAHAALSLDAWLRPGLRRAATPRWTVWLLRFQLGIPYIFSGLSKLSAEWLHGTPAIFFWQSFLVAHPAWQGLDPVAMAYLIAWGGAAADTTLFPLLLWRRTRPLALGLAAVFNVGNALLFSGPFFQVAMFPWLMIAALSIYLEPETPRRVLGRLRPGGPAAPSPASIPPPASLRPRQRVGLVVLALYAAFQFLFPLRYLLYPGFHLWNDSGRAHAWQMMGALKIGRVTFHVTDPVSGQTWVRRPEGALSGDRLAALQRRPSLVYQYALHIERQMAEQGYANVEVRVDAQSSLNGRPMQRLIDPSVDLTAVPMRWGYCPWVLPLETPRRPLAELATATILDTRRGPRTPASE